MPQLENPRHERFAQGLAKGLSATQAYEKAGYKANRGNASTLYSDQSISKRVAELQERIVEGVCLTREWVIDQLIDNVRQAKAGDKMDGSTANKALELLGKELGMFVDRSENVNINHVVSDDLPTADEWEAEHASKH